MNQRNKDRLYDDLLRFTKQIGIHPADTPMLITDRKEMHKLQEQNDIPKSVAAYGQCECELKTIYVNTGLRVARYKKYPMFRVKIVNGSRYGIRTPQPGKKKVTYKDIQNTLAHELVHYRWPKMGHGVAFENRVKQVIKGVVFPPIK